MLRVLRLQRHYYAVGYIQRGKRVALATMRPHCNRDLLAPQSHVRDFNPVFIERALRDLIRPLYDVRKFNGEKANSVLLYLSWRPSHSALN